MEQRITYTEALGMTMEELLEVNEALDYYSTLVEKAVAK